MEAQNTRRKLKCLGGGVTTQILDVGFDYLPPREENDQSANFTEIANMIREKRKVAEKTLDAYVFLNDIADEFRMDYSNMRRFTKSHQIPLHKVRNPKHKNQKCCAVTKKDAKKIVDLKFGG